jgi:hypothetical protein
VQKHWQIKEREKCFTAKVNKLFHCKAEVDLGYFNRGFKTKITQKVILETYKQKGHR